MIGDPNATQIAVDIRGTRDEARQEAVGGPAARALAICAADKGWKTALRAVVEEDAGWVSFQLSRADGADPVDAESLWAWIRS